jgi:hypothetical protein
MDRESIEVVVATVDGQQNFDGGVFPLVLECRTESPDQLSVEHWIQASRTQLDKQAATHGAVLFRGFPLATDQDFDVFVRAFEYPNFPYQDSLSNAVRVNRTERVFTANEAPPGVTICLHHEMAQTPVYPSRLFFFCEQPAEEGGATPLCRSDVLFDRLLQEFPDFIADCESKGLLYTNIMPAENDPTSGMGRSWQSTFRAETREAAEARLQGLGYSWEWLPDGCLRSTTPVLQAVMEVEPDRRISWLERQPQRSHKGHYLRRWQPARSRDYDRCRSDRGRTDVQRAVAEGRCLSGRQPSSDARPPNIPRYSQGTGFARRDGCVKSS